MSNILALNYQTHQLQVAPQQGCCPHQNNQLMNYYNCFFLQEYYLQQQDNLNNNIWHIQQFLADLLCKYYQNLDLQFVISQTLYSKILQISLKCRTISLPSFNVRFVVNNSTHTSLYLVVFSTRGWIIVMSTHHLVSKLYYLLL